MPIKIGNVEIATVFKGNVELDNIRLGDLQQWVGIIVTPDPSIAYVSRTTTSLTFDLTNNHDAPVTMYYGTGNPYPDGATVSVAANATERVTISGLADGTSFTISAVALEADQLPSVGTVSFTQSTATATTAAPSIFNVNPSGESVTFTLRNNDDETATVYYEIGDSTPDIQVTLAPNATTNKTISGLEFSTNYTLFARAKQSNENFSSTVSTSFTTNAYPFLFGTSGTYDDLFKIRKSDMALLAIDTGEDIDYGTQFDGIKLYTGHSQRKPYTWDANDLSFIASSPTSFGAVVLGGHLTSSHYYLHGNNRDIGKYDKNTLARVDQKDVGANTGKSLTGDNTYLYAGGFTGEVARIRQSDLINEQEVTLTGSSGAVYVYADPFDNYLYAVEDNNDKVYKLNKSNLSILQISQSIPYRFQLAVTTNKDFVFTAGMSNGNVTKLRKSDLAILDQTASLGGNTYSLFADNDYVYSGTAYSVKKIRISDMAVVDETPISGAFTILTLIGGVSPYA